ncbi:hypothetical protein BV898_01695 [Hypsibius exemplaris]|uniref:Alpha-1,4-N-acetylglucosaminyltransferase n=1 Tax=Hypsibius exemplaris TaxID=2072580 RepID=A0A1W0XAS4_HYPEX|nr:hypothetical protein BV898_01695 [Hypsibius exemplaris]
MKRPSSPSRNTRVTLYIRAAVFIVVLFGTYLTVDTIYRSFLSKAHLRAAHLHAAALGESSGKEAAPPADGAPDQLLLHYVKFKPDDQTTVTLRFLEYLSVLSAVQRLKPDQIMLHGDLEPTGKYWDELKAQNLIKFVYRPKNFELKGRIKKLAHIYHHADKTKLDILVEYGGLTIDFDVYFVRGERIKAILQVHPALTCYGDEIGYSLGLAGGWKTSRLLHAWRRSFNVIYSTDWNFNCGDVQKYLSEVFSDEVYVVDQVCNNPHPDGHLGPFFNDHGRVHWTDSVAIHTYHRHSGIKQVEVAEDLTSGTLTDYKELLLTIYENRTLPAADPNFRDRIDPLKGIDL